MALKNFKPTSPARRGLILVDKSGLFKGKPVKALTEGKRKTGGRNNKGHVTSRGIGGGHKQKYRFIDFKRRKWDMDATVERIEYDPNRTAHLALLLYADGTRTYIIAPKGVKAGSEIISNETEIAIKPGNCTLLRNIPVGTIIHCVELKPGRGAQMVRSAGSSASIVAKENGYASIRLRSGHIRKVLLVCKAVIGEVSNSEHNLRKLGKAGATRHRGIRPTVRGVAMNPIDHPHGGGEGKTNSGRHPVTPWGKPTKGAKTRRKKASDKLIITRRKPNAKRVG
mgnify:CR=1 FL=1